MNHLKKSMLLFAGIILLSCNGTEDDPIYKEHMRNFVESISYYAKNVNPDFIIIPQNGHELVSETGDNEDTNPSVEYLAAIDGAGQEDLLYGYYRDDKETRESTSEFLNFFLELCETNGVEVLVTDYCSSHENMDDSYHKNNTKGYISFSAPDRELNLIPDYPTTEYNSNDEHIHDLSDAKNFLYIINPESYASKQEFVDAIKSTNYDLVIMDFFYKKEEFTLAQVSAMKKKSNGAKRLIISYMSIGEAEDYRFYWESEWNETEPDWIEEENPKWEGNFKVKYWDPVWQSIIFGSDAAYLDKVLAGGFDGVYLDIIDAFEYFE